jgi:hypothetical protein
MSQTASARGARGAGARAAGAGRALAACALAAWALATTAPGAAIDSAASAAHATIPVPAVTAVIAAPARVDCMWTLRGARRRVTVRAPTGSAGERHR